jgi:starvation-inducible DNA-binding protein
MFNSMRSLTPGAIWRTLSAERLVAIGGIPDGQSSTVASGTGWTRIESRPPESQDVVRIVTRRLAEAAERTRDRADRLGSLDLASQDVAIEALRQLEKQLWMVRVQFGH